jgi:uncharacterized protein YukE
MLLADGGGGGNPTVSGDSFTVKILPVTAGSVSSYTAQEIMELFSGLEPSAVAQAGTAHLAAASKLTDLANAVTTHVSRLQGTWGGEAAQSAVEAFGKLQTSATELANAAQQTGTVLTTLGTDVLPQYQNWTTVVPASGDGLTAAQSQQMQTDANTAAQQKLAELNEALVSANSALPNTVKVTLPTLGKTAGTASVPGFSGSAGSGGVGALPSSSTSTGGGGSSSGGNPHTGTSPTPRIGTPPTTTTKPAPVTLSSAPPPGANPGGGVPGANPGGAPGGTGSTPSTGGNFPGAGTSPVLPASTTPTSPSGGSGPKSGTTPGDDDSVPGTEEPTTGDVPGVPNGILPGSTSPVGGLPPGDDNVSPSGFNNPGAGDGVVPGEDPFGVMPGDTAVIGPDGMIGVPGSPMGGFGAFSSDSAAGGFGPGDPAGSFGGGGIADGNIAAGSVSGADGADGVGGYGGFPMGGGVGGRNNNEKERYRDSWMNEDEELWNGGVPLVPSLIGR